MHHAQQHTRPMRRDICRHGTRLPASRARSASTRKHAPVWFRFINPPNEPASWPQSGQRSATNPCGKQHRPGCTGGQEHPHGLEVARFVENKRPNSAGAHLAQAEGARVAASAAPAEELKWGSVNAPCVEDQDSCPELCVNACSLLCRPVPVANAFPVSPLSVSTHSCTATNKGQTRLQHSCRVSLKFALRFL